MRSSRSHANREPGRANYYNPLTMLPTRIRAAACAIGLGVACAAPVAARDRTVELLRKIADGADAIAIRFDGLASIIATRGTGGPRIMVGAHMDELGGDARRVTPRGLLTCKCSSDGWIRRSSIEVDDHRIQRP